MRDVSSLIGRTLSHYQIVDEIGSGGIGVLLHEMLTGRLPVRGGTGIDTMHAILHDQVPA